ncbi:MAG: phosphoribosyltransferase [Okeania sp. SIO2H7]|nr:phosphoribosyltransferase [Okeania sp. SIO2H7]
MSATFPYENRTAAGEELARVICKEVANLELSPIVCALPRGGVPVAVPIAGSLACPMDAIASKKITSPNNPELAIGAVTADGCVLWSDLKPPTEAIANSLMEETRAKAREQLDAISGGLPEVSRAGKLVILVDDGIATGMTMAAAAMEVQSQNPAQIWICVPVAPPESLSFLEKYCDRLIILQTPQPFLSVSRFYREFTQVETEAVKTYLQEHRERSE